MPTTSNFGWTTPADTDLVKDGAAAIRTLGNGIDTSLIDLKGGTTGQILSKASATDLDYTWINNDQGDLTAVQAGVGITVTDGTGPIPTITNSSTDLITTAGDILYGTAADTVARLGIGTAGQVLTVNSGANAPEWKTGSSVPTAFTLLNAGGTALTGATSITISGISAKEIVVLVDNASTANAYAEVRIRPNNSTSAIYDLFGIYNVITASYSAGNFDARGNYQSSAGIVLFQNGDNAAATGRGFCYIDKTDQTGFKRFQSYGSGRVNGGATGDIHQLTLGGILEFSAAITSITIFSNSGNFDNGTVYVYGS